MDELREGIECMGRELDELLDRAAASDAIPQLGDDELVGFIQSAGAMLRRVEGALVQAADEVAQRSNGARDDRLATRYGCRSPKELLQRATLCDGRSAAAYLRAASAIHRERELTTGAPLPARYPALREALVAGHVGAAGVVAATAPLERSASRADPEDVLLADRQLAEAATGHVDGEPDAPPAAADDLGFLARTIVSYLDPDGAEPAEAIAMRKRGLSLGKARDGLVPVRGELLPEVAGQLRRIFDSLLSPKVSGRAPGDGELWAMHSGELEGGLADDAGAARFDGSGDGAVGDGFPSDGGGMNGEHGAGGYSGDRGGGNGDSNRGGVIGEAVRVRVARPGDARGGELGDARSDECRVTPGELGQVRFEGSGNTSELPPDPDAPPASAADLRTRAQKQHDALAAALGVAARSGELPTIGGAAPTLVVSVRADDYVAGSGWAQVEGVDEPVAMSAARHIACCGNVQRVLFDDGGRIAGIGISDRVFNAAQRRAIALRDGGCVIPGCHVPASWCEIHHVTEHAQGGPTHTDNGAMLCWHHHRTLETSGWRVRICDGFPEVRGPTWWDPHVRWRRTRSPAAGPRKRAPRRRVAS